MSSVAGKLLDVRTIEPGWAAANNPADFALTTEWAQYTFDIVANANGSMRRKMWMAIAAGDTEAHDIYIDRAEFFYLGCQ